MNYEGLAYVDTETTGLLPDRHEIWEVGLVLDPPPGRRLNFSQSRARDAARPPGSYSFKDTPPPHFLWQLPVDLGKADPVALDIGRFHERRWKTSALTALDIFATDFAELTRGRHLVGGIVSFDEQRLARLLTANGACPEWHYHIIDVEALMLGFIAGRRDVWGLKGPHPFAPPWRSSEVAAALGITRQDEVIHTALGDALWAKEVYETVMGAR